MLNRIETDSGLSPRFAKEPYLTTVFRGDVLIVEDNFIIAMDAEELMIELGATNVHIASTCDEALNAIGAAEISAAILDFNLDNDTSISVADALHERGTPFVFATGYSDLSILPERYQSQPLLKKPYTREDIAAVFRPVSDSSSDS